MTDRELLELAAKAAGICGDYSQRANAIVNEDGYWMPLTDDGDALRLAVALRMDLNINDGECDAFVDEAFVMERNDDTGRAVRRAIVRAAAAIAQQEQPQ